MPFELIVQQPFMERLENNRVRSRAAGEHITDPVEIATVKAGYGTQVVQVWVDEPAATTSPASAPKPEAMPVMAATSVPEVDPADAPVAH